MKNTKYFPFERNRYFLGKLLGVGDFEVEQKYVNDKRRVINRLLHGVGIVCGLNVIKVDDSIISIESGLALDYVGREILIDNPVIKKLSMFDGFDQDKNPNDSSCVYLCIKYDEEETESIHSITNAINMGDDNTEYNKYREGYSLYLDYNEPEVQPSEALNMSSNTYKIYDEGGVCIKHTIPKYVKEGENFDLTVSIEKNSLTTNIVLNYDISLQCVDYMGQEKLNINFDESKLIKSEKYEIKYKLTARQVKEVQGLFSVNPENFKLQIGAKDVRLDMRKEALINIIDRNIKDEILKKYFTTSMDDIVNSTIDQKIYLAKIYLVKAANTYIIENIENNPFNQYVLNSALLQSFEKVEEDKVKNIKVDNCLSEKTIIKNDNKIVEKDLDIQSGVVRLKLNGKAKSGTIVFSDEITHKVGLGNVYVVLGVENQYDGETIFGNTDIFRTTKNVALAAKTNTKRGTMIIGVKLLENIEDTNINIRWMVYRDSKEKTKDIEQITMNIKPDISNINVRDTIYLESVCTGLTDKRCTWSIKEKEGGSIDENGKYTAPSTPGIYEIVAKSIINPKISSSTFIVVRSDNK